MFTSSPQSVILDGPERVAVIAPRIYMHHVGAGAGEVELYANEIASEEEVRRLLRNGMVVRIPDKLRDSVFADGLSFDQRREIIRESLRISRL